MDELTIEQVLENIRRQLRLSKEQETELLAEMRSHLEEAVAQAGANGLSTQEALQRAAEELGSELVGTELQQVYAGRELGSAVTATAMPVLFALVLRWLVFAPAGSELDWPQLLAQPGFWIIAAAALLLPALAFRRWRLALAGWVFFWLLTVIFFIFPSTNQW